MLLCERALISPVGLLFTAIFCWAPRNTAFSPTLPKVLPPRSFWLRSGRLIGAYNIYHWHFDIASLAGAEGAGRRLVGRRRSRAMTNRILVLFKMALNHGSRLAQENAETGNNNKDTHQDVIACVHAWKDNDDMAGNRVLDSGLRTQDSRWLPVHPIHGISTRAKQD